MQNVSFRCDELMEEPQICTLRKKPNYFNYILCLCNLFVEQKLWNSSLSLLLLKVLILIKVYAFLFNSLVFFILSS